MDEREESLVESDLLVESTNMSREIALKTRMLQEFAGWGE